jgi:predicted methyltransferase
MRLAAAVLIALSGGLFAQSGGACAAESQVPAYVTSAVENPSRAADVAADARRHPVEVAAFSKVKPGDTIVELIPGNGYFTRIFSKIVGPKGHIYALWPTQYANEAKSNLDDMRKMAATPEYSNVEVVVQPAREFKMPKPLDEVFTSQNFHDYPDKFMGPADPLLFSQQVFASLKPGGYFIVIDHVADAGSGLRDTDTLHRIDPAKAKEIVLQAGFKFDGETDVLRNPADDHKSTVFDKSIRGHTDQFAYRFRKPKT